MAISKYFYIIRIHFEVYGQIGLNIEMFKEKTNFEKTNTMKPTTEKIKSKENKPLRDNTPRFAHKILNANKLAKANTNLKKLDELQQLQKIKWRC